MHISIAKAQGSKDVQLEKLKRQDLESLTTKPLDKVIFKSLAKIKKDCQ